MALYTLADLHLATDVAKPMDIFGGRWEGHTDKIIRHWRELIAPEDTVVLGGDISWGISLAEAKGDFALIDSLPGRKIILKGNHDLWWETASKMHRFLDENGFASIDFLHNNCHFYREHALCGTRGWFFEEDQKPHNAKVLSREVGRLETSLKAAEGKPIWCFLHYPPLYQGYQCREILEMLEKYSVEQCCYGHLHGPVIRRRIEGERGNTAFSLISADYLGFVPKKICD